MSTQHAPCRILLSSARWCVFSRLTHFGFGRGERLIELVVSLVSVSLRHRRASVVAQTRALASTERKMLSIFFFFNHSRYPCHCQGMLCATLFERTRCTFGEVQIDDRFCERLTSATSPRCGNETISWRRFFGSQGVWSKRSIQASAVCFSLLQSVASSASCQK